MSASAPRPVIPAIDVDYIREAREIIRQEANGLLEVSDRLDAAFPRAVERLLTCRGNVVVTGVGKAGLIGQKITATLSSTGSPAHFLHPAEAVHGDLGCLNPDDVILALSNSGESEEVSRLLPILCEMELPIIAITGTTENTLAQAASVVLTLGKLKEAGDLALAPTTSTTAMAAVGDALALVTSRARGFTSNDFASVHPAGKLGRQLQRVADVMRQPPELRIARETEPLRELLVQVARPGRRSGAVMLVDATGRLTGLFTDSDLARLLEQRRDAQLDAPASETMTANPVTVTQELRISEAIDKLSERKLSELPVVDTAGQPVGLLDITDLIGIDGVPSVSTSQPLRLASPPSDSPPASA